MDRFFGPTATAVANPFAKKDLPSGKPAAEGLGEGVRAIKVPLEDLMKSYVVSYAGLLGDRGADDKQMSRESSDEASCSESDHEEDAEPAGEPDEEDKEDEEDNVAGKKKKKQKKRVVKRDRVGDYDFEDPFIDDDEVAVAYESIFDLLHGAPDDEMADIDTVHEEKKVKRRSCGGDDEKPPLREFYVYRGEMQVEVVSKLKGKKKKKEAGGENDSTAEEAPKRTKKNKKTSEKASEEVKVKKVKEKKEKAPKRETKPVVVEKPVSTLERILNLEAKLEIAPSKQPSTEESAKGTPEKSKRNIVDYDRLFAELETKLSLEAWKAQARSMESFDQSKFPSALRDLTGSLAICYLRAAAPHHSAIEDSLFEELARMVPYSSVSLRKVTFKKILPLFFQEIQKKLESLYVAFTNESQHLALPSNSQPEVASQEDPAASQPGNKSRLKFNEITRQLIYEIVRFELDSAYIEQSLRMYEPSDPAAPPPKLPGEMLLRKSIYQKIFKALPSSLCDFTTTNEISLQYGQQKRKIERKALKDHGVEVEVLGEKRKAPTPPSALALNEPVTAADAQVESAPKRLDPQPPSSSTQSQDQRNMFAQMLFSTENVPQN